MISLEEIRSDLLPELEKRFGETRCRIEFGKRLFFKFKTEESSLCGHAILNEYLASREIPGRVISSTEPKAVILILGEDEL